MLEIEFEIELTKREFMRYCRPVKMRDAEVPNSDRLSLLRINIFPTMSGSIRAKKGMAYLEDIL